MADSRSPFSYRAPSAPSALTATDVAREWLLRHEGFSPSDSRKCASAAVEVFFSQFGWKPDTKVDTPLLLETTRWNNKRREYRTSYRLFVRVSRVSRSSVEVPEISFSSIQRPERRLFPMKTHYHCRATSKLISFI